jgi:tetratricopeptide (TPR) repeat protein
MNAIIPPEPPAPPAPPAAAAPVELEVRRIRDLFDGRRFAESLAAAEVLARRVPENRDVLYLMAISQRFLQQIPAAMATLERLERHHPRYSRLHQERGNCHVALKQARPAIDAFIVGVNINPAMPQSWGLLEGLYRMVGEHENAAMAAAHVATLKRLPPEVVTATALFSDGDLAPAEAVIRAYLLKHGDQVEAMRLLARIGIERQVFDDAEVLLEAVLKLAPEYHAARHDYARALLERHKHLRAREELESLLQLEPQNRQYRTLYATACVGLGEHEKSVAMYRDLLDEMPDAADLRLSLAHSLKTLGRRQEAIEAYRAVAAARNDYGDAYWSLANLKTYRFTSEEIDRMRAAEAAPGTGPADHFHLCFALGKAFEDAGDYAQSFHYYEHGNALKRRGSRYRPEIIERNTRRQIEVCTREFFDSRRGAGVADRDPIFIVGLPRSGSTLIEQILASHSRVEGTQELADIPRIVLELQGQQPDLDNPRYPGVLRRLDPGEFRRLGEKYLRDTRIYRTGAAAGSGGAADTGAARMPHFIDKMPNNFRHIGLIHLMLPNARIIDARREPLACCFSNLKQLFAAGQEFTYSIEDIARYYRTYLDLMAHWDVALPGKVLRVEHEAVVDDLEGSVRRILRHCELEFEPGCVEFHRNERSVRTASSEQVRQPIFRDGLDQWRRFEPWLQPLKDALGDALHRYRS